MARDVVVFEGVEQPGLDKRGRRPRLVARSPIAVERNADQLDLGDCPAPRVRTIAAYPSVIRPLSSLPYSSTPVSPSMITPRT